MDQFTKAGLTVLRADINAALVAVGQKHNITISANNASFTSKSVKFKLEAAVAGHNPEQATWNEHCGSIGLKASDFGRKLKVHGNLFEIAGFNPKARKFPVIGLKGGKMYKLTVNHCTNHNFVD